MRSSFHPGAIIWEIRVRIYIRLSVKVPFQKEAKDLEQLTDPKRTGER